MLEKLIWKTIEEVTDLRTLKTALALLLVLTVAAVVPIAASGLLEKSGAGDIVERQLSGLRKTSNESFQKLPLKIFLNNIKVSIIIATLYPTVIIPIAVLIINGLMIGLLPLVFDLGSATSEIGIHLSPGDKGFFYYIGLVPHGMLEMTTILLVASLVGYLFSEGLRGVVTRMLGRLLLAGINLLVAAIVETLVTPVLMIVVLLIIG